MSVQPNPISLPPEPSDEAWLRRLWPISPVLVVLDEGNADGREPWLQSLMAEAAHQASRPGITPLTLLWSPQSERPLPHALSSLVGLGDLAAQAICPDDIRSTLADLAHRGTPEVLIGIHGIDAWLAAEPREQLDATTGPSANPSLHNRRWFEALMSGGHEHLHVLVALDARLEPAILAWQNRHHHAAQPQVVRRACAASDISVDSESGSLKSAANPSPNTASPAAARVQRAFPRMRLTWVLALVVIAAIATAAVSTIGRNAPGTTTQAT